MEAFKEKYRRFKEWQQQPYQVAPMSAEAHDCPTCGTHFEGNYCPRCGQSARIGRYSFKKAFLLFLDVWGLGNRGMFRTIRDLILRPGYMIRDYLQGMQMAYFPPFKMFFLLVALSLLVSTGWNIKMENRIEKQEKEITEKINRTIYGSFGLEEKENNHSVEALETNIKITEWTNKHMNLVTILLLLLYTIPLFMFFRKCPAYPGIRFSEFFVTMVYITNMITVYSIVTNFFGLSLWVDVGLYVLTLIPLKQLSGYSYWRVIWNCIAALVLFFIVGIFIIFAIAITLSIASNYYQQ